MHIACNLWGLAFFLGEIPWRCLKVVTCISTFFLLLGPVPLWLHGSVTLPVSLHFRSLNSVYSSKLELRRGSDKCRSPAGPVLVTAVAGLLAIFPATQGYKYQPNAIHHIQINQMQTYTFILPFSFTSCVLTNLHLGFNFSSLLKTKCPGDLSVLVQRASLFLLRTTEDFMCGNAQIDFVRLC